MESIHYDKNIGIEVKGIHYPTFSKACSALKIPRQQSLRAFRNGTFYNQTDIDSFFDNMVEIYHSVAYKKKMESRKHFKDGRVSPFRFKNATFRSKEALATHLGAAPNAFKTRLNYLSTTGVNLTDAIIEICAKPLHKSVFSIELDRKIIAHRLSENYECNISPQRLKSWCNSPDSPFLLPLTIISGLFGIEYETLKRQVYDTKFSKKPSAIDVLGAASMLRPTLTETYLNGKQYKSLLSMMVDVSYKINKQNVSKVLSISSSILKKEG
tara:strand:+ start:9443 stop:10249 length:807 start_codon:yes stop_codon:yes gene_type:complete